MAVGFFDLGLQRALWRDAAWTVSSHQRLKVRDTSSGWMPVLKKMVVFVLRACLFLFDCILNLGIMLTFKAWRNLVQWKRFRELIERQRFHARLIEQRANEHPLMQLLRDAGLAYQDEWSKQIDALDVDSSDTQDITTAWQALCKQRTALNACMKLKKDKGSYLVRIHGFRDALALTRKELLVKPSDNQYFINTVRVVLSHIVNLGEMPDAVQAWVKKLQSWCQIALARYNDEGDERYQPWDYDALKALQQPLDAMRRDVGTEHGLDAIFNAVERLVVPFLFAVQSRVDNQGYGMLCWFQSRYLHSCLPASNATRDEESHATIPFVAKAMLQPWRAKLDAARALCDARLSSMLPFGGQRWPDRFSDLFDERESRCAQRIYNTVQALPVEQTAITQGVHSGNAFGGERVPVPDSKVVTAS